MAEVVEIGGTPVGRGHPCYFIAEIGINHNGDIGIAKKLVDAAGLAGCDAVKFQKRTPDLCVPEEQKDLLRETPWGVMTYLDYKHRVEFGEDQFEEIDRYCRDKPMTWFASCWDEPSVEFIDRYDPPCYKVASASLTDESLLRLIDGKGRPVILSTGMSTMNEIAGAVKLIDPNRLLIAHSTSTYPCPPEELNLKMLETLLTEYDCPVGYSGHETGLQTSVAAAVLGASFIERHITLDRAMWGTDQAASVEPHGISRLVRDVRVIERALGDGVKRVYDSEVPIRDKLRKK